MPDKISDPDEIVTQLEELKRLSNCLKERLQPEGLVDKGLLTVIGDLDRIVRAHKRSQEPVFHEPFAIWIEDEPIVSGYFEDAFSTLDSKHSYYSLSNGFAGANAILKYKPWVVISDMYHEGDDGPILIDKALEVNPLAVVGLVHGDKPKYFKHHDFELIKPPQQEELIGLLRAAYTVAERRMKKENELSQKLEISIDDLRKVNSCVRPIPDSFINQERFKDGEEIRLFRIVSDLNPSYEDFKDTFDTLFQSTYGITFIPGKINEILPKSPISDMISYVYKNILLDSKELEPYRVK